MTISDMYAPIRNFGYFLVAIGICGFVVVFTMLADVKYLFIVWSFITSVSALHLFLGVGVVLRSKWIFPLFKGYLRMLYIGFPIGTYISHKTLKYIERNHIERYLR